MAPTAPVSARQVGRALAGLVLDLGCAGCSVGDGLVCAACAAALSRPAYAAPPDPVPPRLPVPWAVAPYAGVVRELLLAHKERTRLGLAAPLGAALARSITAAAPRRGDLVLVPVPSSPAAVRRRGHDALRRTAQAAAGVLRGSGRTTEVLPVLRLHRRAADQAGLSSAARRANLAGALAVPPALRPLVLGRHVVVVDDVVTTGATLADAARALRAAGPGSVSTAVIAATERHHRSPVVLP